MNSEPKHHSKSTQQATRAALLDGACLRATIKDVTKANEQGARAYMEENAGAADSTEEGAHADGPRGHPALGVGPGLLRGRGNRRLPRSWRNCREAPRRVFPLGRDRARRRGRARHPAAPRHLLQEW